MIRAPGQPVGEGEECCKGAEVQNSRVWGLGFRVTET